MQKLIAVNLTFSYELSRNTPMSVSENPEIAKLLNDGWRISSYQSLSNGVANYSIIILLEKAAA